MSRSSKLILPLLAIIAVLAVALVLLFQSPTPSSVPEISYTQFLQQDAQVKALVVSGDLVTGQDAAGRRFTTRVPSGAATADRLAQRGVEVTVTPPAGQTGTAEIVASLISYGLFLILLWSLRRIALALEAARRSPASP